jgi:hypothetical protein
MPASEGSAHRPIWNLNIMRKGTPPILRTAPGWASPLLRTSPTMASPARLTMAALSTRAIASSSPTASPEK